MISESGQVKQVFEYKCYLCEYVLIRDTYKLLVVEAEEHEKIHHIK